MLVDAFLFNGEMDILNLRLHELEDVVDYFVIVESREYHGSGRSKPLRGSLLRNLPKVEYALVPHLEPPFKDSDSAWARENFHRNSILPYVLNLNPRRDDLLMLSDADEIPRASAVLKWVMGHSTLQLYAAAQDFFYYNVNNYIGEWHGTVMGTMEAFAKNGTLQDARMKRDGLPVIENCGWHASYFSGLKRVKQKLANFAHACEDSAKQVLRKTDEQLVADMLAGRDIFDRPGMMRLEHRSSNDPRLPKFLPRHFTEEGLAELLEKELHG